MNINKKIILLLLISIFSFAHGKTQLLFYVGITMVKPVDALAREFEQSCNCTIKILQGGSQDLYDSIKSSQVGDMYFPGSVSYRNNNLKDNLLLDGKFVGYNKLSLVVKKGNPKGIKPSLQELTNENLNVVLGNEASGSVGKASKKVLKENNLYEQAIMNAIFLVPDSRNLINSIKEDKADLILNWHATTFWDDNKEYVQAIELEDKYSNKSKLVMNLLSTSKYKELTKSFLDFAASTRGREVFKNYGFLSEEDLKLFDKVTF